MTEIKTMTQVALYVETTPGFYRFADWLIGLTLSRPKAAHEFFRRQSGRKDDGSFVMERIRTVVDGNPAYDGKRHEQVCRVGWAFRSTIVDSSFDWSAFVEQEKKALRAAGLID